MSTIAIGTAPDSWDVWFPSDPAELGEALAEHNLPVLAGTVFAHLDQLGACAYLGSCSDVAIDMGAVR